MKSKSTRRPPIDFSAAGMSRAMKHATPPKTAPRAATPPAPAGNAAEEAVSDCMEFIDRRGKPPMSKASWIEMLELIISECHMRMELTRAELRKEGEDA